MARCNLVRLDNCNLCNVSKNIKTLFDAVCALQAEAPCDQAKLVGIFPTGAQEHLDTPSSGAPYVNISLTSYLTTVNTTDGTDIYTLPDGLYKGHMKKIYLQVDGGADLQIIPETPFESGEPALILDDETDFAVMIWTCNEQWRVIENFGGTLGDIP